MPPLHDWSGFAFEGTWGLTGEIQQMLEEEYPGEMVLEERPEIKLLVAYRLSFERYRESIGKNFPEYNLFLIDSDAYSKEYLQPVKEVEQTDGRHYILAGIQLGHEYSINDFFSVAQKLGFRETDSFTQEQLEELTQKALTPYNHPYNSALRDLRETSGCHVWLS